MGFAEKNNGLPTNWLLEDGKFKLISGGDKVDDNMTLLMSFVGWFRIFLEDFAIRGHWLFERNKYLVNKYKNTFRLQVIHIFKKYIQFAVLDDIDLPITKKDIRFDVSFKYNLPTVSKKTKVTFVKSI